MVLGRGGESALRASDIAAAAASVPDRDWHVLGEVDGVADAALPPNLHLHGWVADPAAHVARAAIVVGAAGDGVRRPRRPPWGKALRLPSGAAPL